MKSLKSITCFILLFLLGFTVKALDNNDEKLNLPGDNLNLYAVMNLFSESETLEGFEKNLNAEDSKINNLDLNGDDKIDYIKVIDYVDGEAHTIVLQVAVNERENQDVAVFTVQKDDKNQVQVQLIGDEELYGKDYIIEPNYDDNSSTSVTPNPGYTGNTKIVEKETIVVTKTTYVEVASWPVVTYMYVPTYVVWRSPWYWGYYPSYWSPWRPYYYDYYYGYHSHYHNHYYGYYRHSHYNRYPHYNDHYYHGHRAYSNTVNQHRQSGMYKNTYSHPETRKQGSADFTKKYPNGYKPSARPGTNNANRPTTKPGTNTNVNRPTTKPGNNTNASRPSTRPDATKPSTRPTTTNPASKPGVTNPSTRPSTTKPSAKPGTSKPSTRPTNTAPNGKPSLTKPSTRPSNTSPTSKPSGTKPSAKPSTRPVNTKPADKPASNKTSGGTQKTKSNNTNEKQRK